MRALVIYESMYGNTHHIAEAIGEGLQSFDGVDVMVVPVNGADAAVVHGADLVVIGGPTHAHGMLRARTRDAAALDARKPERELTLDPDAEGAGLREWFEALGHVDPSAFGAAFDTRFDMSAAFTGRASRGIARQLQRHGFGTVVEPESFFVTRDNHLVDGESARARQWGAHLVAMQARSTRPAAHAS